MNKWGMHGPNKEPTNIAEMLSLGGDCYVVMDKWGQVWTIRDLRPSALILLRPYWGACSLHDDPVARARWCADFLGPYLVASKHVVIGNEFNSEAGGFPEDDVDGWKLLNDWIVASVATFRRLVPDAVMHWPALSPWFGDYPPHLDPPGLTYCKESIDACDIVDAHIYWNPLNRTWHSEHQGRRMAWLHRYCPNKYMFISEAGPVDTRYPPAKDQVIQWFRILEDEFPYVLGGALFMWNWGQASAEAPFNYFDKPHIIEAIRNSPKKEFPLPSSWQYGEQGGNVIDIVDSLPRSGAPKTRRLELIDKIVVHHAAAVTTPERTARYHVETKGWPTIGYHYFITEDGTIYYTARLGEITYHCGEHNPTSVGICLSGAFHGFNLPPTTAQLEALNLLIDALQNKLDLGNRAVKGHYELRPTLCPGSEWFEDWRRWFFPQSDAEEEDNQQMLIEELERRVAEFENEIAEMRGDFDMIAEIAERWRSG